jgi:hypothetical protein
MGREIESRQGIKRSLFEKIMDKIKRSPGGVASCLPPEQKIPGSKPARM